MGTWRGPSARSTVSPPAPRQCSASPGGPPRHCARRVIVTPRPQGGRSRVTHRHQGRIILMPSIRPARHENLEELLSLIRAYYRFDGMVFRSGFHPGGPGPVARRPQTRSSLGRRAQGAPGGLRHAHLQLRPRVRRPPGHPHQPLRGDPTPGKWSGNVAARRGGAPLPSPAHRQLRTAGGLVEPPGAALLCSRRVRAPPSAGDGQVTRRLTRGEHAHPQTPRAGPRLRTPRPLSGWALTLPEPGAAPPTDRGSVDAVPRPASFRSSGQPRRRAHRRTGLTGRPGRRWGPGPPHRPGPRAS